MMMESTLLAMAPMAGIYYDGVAIDSTNARIDSIRLRDILLEHSHIDFLKIDIEGAENEVMLDCKDSLNHIEHIFIEYHKRPNSTQNLGNIINILDKAGFRIYLENITKHKSPFCVESRFDAFELQVNIFAIKG